MVLTEGQKESIRKYRQKTKDRINELQRARDRLKKDNEEYKQKCKERYERIRNDKDLKEKYNEYHRNYQTKRRLEKKDLSEKVSEEAKD